MSSGTVLITGCSEGGVGDALVQEFARRGYQVIATVRNLDKAAHYVDMERIEAVTLDVTSSESIKSVEADLRSRLPGGGLDVLVNNAGIGATGPLTEVDLEHAKRLYEVNVLGLLAVTQAFVPMLIAAKGRVVNISSVGGLVVLPWGGLYHSSKAAVTIMSETLRLELAPFGVTVVTAMLGAIESNFHANDSWEGLPENSAYKSIETHVEKVAKGQVGPKRENRADFAHRLVEDVLGGASGQIWRGAMAQTVRAIGYHAPSSLMVRLAGSTILTKLPEHLYTDQQQDRMILPESGLSELAKKLPH